MGKKIISLILITLLTSTLLIGCQSDTNQQSDSEETTTKTEIIKIGITQIVEHPALDAARNGFIDALKSKNFKDGKNIELDYQNAQGDIPTAQTIAKNFQDNKKDLILAIATPTAQAAYNVTKEIPILITAVTDPVEAGLANSWERSGTNVAGTSDATPIDKQFKLLKKLVPNVKKVGIVYNTSETNSEIQVSKAKEIAPKYDIEIVTSGITNVNEIAQSLDSLLDKVDVIYVPTDNVIASSMPLMYEKCTDKGVPMIGSESAHVQSGALATEGIDYYNLGFQTGLIAVDVINGSKTEDMPISTLEETTLVINTKAAEELNIEIPKDLINKAETIEEVK